jgi:dTDP-4-dehydrorhamnose reductase
MTPSMRVAILGSSGILGQHMRLCVPEGIEVIFCRRTADPLHHGLDITDSDALRDFFKEHSPDVVLNLAGENRPDVVEQAPGSHLRINVGAARVLAMSCESLGVHYIHVSSQAVFSGEDPPYGFESETKPINEYGRQKLAADLSVRNGERWTIVRPTFMLGVRPLPLVGRCNPLEQMFSWDEQEQVSDRWFSPLFARDAARFMWRVVQDQPARKVIHLGDPARVCRYDIAIAANPAAKVTPVRHDESFPDFAPRPLDTTFAEGSWFDSDLATGIELCRDEWVGRTEMDALGRAREIAMFLACDEKEAYDRLTKGFGELHAAVAEDFRRANPESDDELLAWYRETDTYIWELSAYHCDQGFNYAGLCEGLAQRLTAAGTSRILCLGDGIGDLTLSLHGKGFDAVYHDLAGSRTAEFAAFRYWIHTAEEMVRVLTEGWGPSIGQRYDAIVSLDFLEHVVNVEEWATAINDVLRPGGLFFAQNAFAIGSGPEGSIPMHLTRNDRFEREWLPLLDSLGFQAESDNWFQRAA